MQTPLKTIRIQKGYTQTEISDKVNVSTRHYQRYESGELTPPVKTALKLAQILSTNIESIFTEIN